MSVQDEAKEAEEIAAVVESLAMLHGRPEAFHLNKDEAVRRLRRMAGRLRGDGARNRRPSHVWRAPR